MNFDLSEDEELLKALVERFVEERYDLERRRRYLSSETGFSAENWSLLGELGLIGAMFDVEDGGAGLDATAISVVFEALGRGLVVEPLIDNILLAGNVFAATAGQDLRRDWLEQVVSGTRRVAFAHLEEGARDDRLWVNMHADHGATIALTGTKSVVAGAVGADGFIVTARQEGEPSNEESMGLYFVEASAPGLTLHQWRGADGGVLATLELSKTPGALLEGGWASVGAVLPRCSLARCAEGVGIMRRMMEETLDYLRTRQQFGAPLGSFQAIQHRMAAQYAQLEQGRALLDLAIMSSQTADFAQAVDSARAFIADASVTFGHEMIQFHGGMGVSDELSIGHAHKRLFFLSRWPESPDATLDRVAGVP